jgi:ketoreductase RED2
VAEGEQLAANLPDAMYVQADVSDPADAKRLVGATVERYGRLDIVVNNAGTTTVIPHHDLDAATSEIWDRILRVNVVGPWNVIQAAAPHLRASGDGVILNITSLAGVRPVGSSIPYAVSKAALNHMTVLLANALGPEIRVHAVAPGLIDTAWTADWDTVREAVREAAPLRRSGQPEDVADACVALIGARYSTGQVLVVDGGMGLR